MTDATIHITTSAARKAAWVRASRAAGMRLGDWIIERVEASMHKSDAIPAPTPEAVRAARAAAGHTQAEAAALVHYRSNTRWAEDEREGGPGMRDLARWELYLIKTAQHSASR
jgi:hypothetical protein